MCYDIRHRCNEATYPSLGSSDAEVGIGYIAWSMCILETAELLLCHGILTVQILQGSDSCEKEDKSL